MVLELAMAAWLQLAYATENLVHTPPRIRREEKMQRIQPLVDTALICFKTQFQTNERTEGPTPFERIEKAAHFCIGAVQDLKHGYEYYFGQGTADDYFEDEFLDKVSKLLDSLQKRSGP